MSRALRIVEKVAPNAWKFQPVGWKLREEVCFMERMKLNKKEGGI